MSKIITLHPTRAGCPNTVNGKVPSRRPKNTDVRAREYLTEKEVNALIEAARRTGRHRHRDAGIRFPLHPHMLRHACGFKLANEGHDTRAIQHYLGHRNIQHTVWCTELAADRCNSFWRD